VDGATARLAELGFSEYESKAYLALLAANPATAYETAKRAGIPSSKIYEVLQRMASRGLVMSVEEGERRLYIPESAEEFIDGQKARLGRALQELSGELASLKSSSDASALWNVRDRAALMDRAVTIVSRAAKEILLSGESEELDELSRPLADAHGRGARIAIVHFGEQRGSLPGVVYPHPIKDTLQSEKGGRGFTLVSDSREALVGTMGSQGRTEGAYSRNRGFVVLAEDYVKHDIYVMKMLKGREKEIEARFGANFALLRDVFSDTRL
jgi:sugar-specific transcriptional regulator TrmB